MKLVVLAAAAAAVLGAADAPPFSWQGSIAPGNTLEIKGINGNITVEPSTASAVQVSARITARRADPNQVRVEVVPRGGDVRICSVYPTDSGPVGCEGRGNVRDNDTKVHFTVRLPRGVGLKATTVNGSVTALRLQSPVVASTVNGPVQVSTSETASAKTVNGDVEADMGQFANSAQFSTVNGSIRVGLPPSAGANVRASTVNGSITPDFPLTVTGTFSHRKMSGRLNNGGPELVLSTVNGSIHIRPSTGVI